MLRKIFAQANRRRSTNVLLLQFNQKREFHDRNRKAKVFITRGWSAMEEVDRVIDFAEFQDSRLIPYLRTAKENFEKAIEVDNTNAEARYRLGKLHLGYHVPQGCQSVGAALIEESANMGYSPAQYKFGCLLRKAGEEERAMYYFRLAADQKHPESNFFLGIAYYTGICVIKDVDLALWHFHQASAKGHAAAAIAYGSLLLKGVEVPESVKKLSAMKVPLFLRSKDGEESRPKDRFELAQEQFEIAVKAGSDLGFIWLEIVDEERELSQAKLNP